MCAISPKKGDMPMISHLDREEIRALLDAPASGTWSDIRDRAILCLVYNAGLCVSVSELVGPILGDLNPLHLDEVSGSAPWKETRSSLRDWLRIRPDAADRHLFINAMKTVITWRGFAKWLALHAETAVLKSLWVASNKTTPYVFRHRYATDTLEATRNVRKIPL